MPSEWWGQSGSIIQPSSPSAISSSQLTFQQRQPIAPNGSTGPARCDDSHCDLTGITLVQLAICWAISSASWRLAATTQ